MGRRADVFIALALIICLVCDYVLARANPPNADLMQDYLELLSVRHGNILLNHWYLGADNFYLTDLPFFLALSALFGVHMMLIAVEPVVVFGLLLLGALCLVRNAPPPGAGRWWAMAAILLLLGVPFTHAQSIFLAPSIHTAPVMLGLYALLCIQPLLQGQAFSRRRFVPFGLLLAAIFISDPQMDLLYGVPILLFIIMRRWLVPGWRLDDWLIFFITLAAAAVGGLWPGFILRHHGYTTALNFNPGLVANGAVVWQNLLAQAASLRIFFAGQQSLYPAMPGGWLLAMTRSCSMALVLACCAGVLWRLPRDGARGIAPVLALGACCLAAANACGQAFVLATAPGLEYPGPANRYVAPIFILAAVAGVLRAQEFLAAVDHRRFRQAAAVLLAAFAAVFVCGAAQAVAAAGGLPPGYRQAPQYDVARWLNARGYHYGVGDYWTANMVTALTQGRVMTDAVIATPKLAGFPLNTDFTRLDRHIRPQFVVAEQGNIYGVTLGSVTQTYGKPAAVTQIGRFTVMALASAAAP